MFKLWCMLQSSVCSQESLNESLRKYSESVKKPIIGYFKQDTNAPITNIKESQLKSNEKEFLKKLKSSMNIEENFLVDLYFAYIESSFNQLIISDEALEKLNVIDLVNVHFQKFDEYYQRERYSFLRLKIKIAASLTENSPYQYDQQKNLSNHSTLIKLHFKENDLNIFFNSALKDYEDLCNQIKKTSYKKPINELAVNNESIQEQNIVHSIKELELTLELILILSNLIEVEKENFNQFVKIFNSCSIIKYLNTLTCLHSTSNQYCIEQISYLQSLVVIKLLRLETFISTNLLSYDENKSKIFTQAEKNELIERKTLINDLINACGSNKKGSPICLAWATLLYNFSVDTTLNISPQVMQSLKTSINRLFNLSIKENVFGHLLDMFALNLFDEESNELLLWHSKQILYSFLNMVLNTFDVERMASENLKYLFELTFFCMNKNEFVCENFWKSCTNQTMNADSSPDLTVLMLYAIEKFPISFGLCFTFFSLISKTNPEFCQETLDFLSRQMDQYCEYLDTINSEEFQIQTTNNEDSIRLVKNRFLFDNCVLSVGTRGLLTNLNQSKMAWCGKNSILKSTAVNWTVKFNCLIFMESYLNRFNYAIESVLSSLSFESDFFSSDSESLNNVINIIELINSLFKHFFSINEEDAYGYEINTKHMENFVNTCFRLFKHLISMQSRNSFRLLTKLFEFFNNISPSVYDKLIKQLEENNLIGYDNIYSKMNLEEIFNNRFSLINSYTTQLFIFNSQDGQLVLNYLKLVESLIKQSGNNIKYLSPICCVLVLVFPQIHKWNDSTLNFNMELSLTCLNLLHAVLNTTTNSSLPSSSFRIDQFCELLLINTECSESLLGLINCSYECSQNLNYITHIKKLDHILIQSVSLVNRLIVITDNKEAKESQHSKKCIDQSLLYINLIKSINIQSQNSLINTIKNDTGTSDETIKNNNQFLMQLNTMMRSANSLSDQSIDSLSTLQQNTNSNPNEVNWFHLLTKICVFKSNQILDGLLFSIFKKIAQLTPPLFGSLLGPYVQKFHEIVFKKLSIDSNDQILTITSEFLCSIIKYQSGYFQTLACIKKGDSLNDSTSSSFVEGEQSVLKAMFDLLKKVKELNKNQKKYYVFLSGLFNVFFTLWSNKKHEYIDYCKQKTEFWPMLISTLKIKNTKQQIDKKPSVFNLSNSTISWGSNRNTYNLQCSNDDLNFLIDENKFDYTDYFDIDNRTFAINEFEQFILETICKSASCAFKIFSIEYFQLVSNERLRASMSNIDLPNNTLSDSFFKLLSESVIDQNLIEKWLDFYAFQLKKDINDEIKNNMTKMDNFFFLLNNDNNYNSPLYKAYQNDASKSPTLKSKQLFDSIKTFLLLVNKISRLSPISNSIGSNLINTKRIKQDLVLNHLIDSIDSMINYFLILNNLISRVKQECEDQQMDEAKYENNSTITQTNERFSSLNVTWLKHSDEIDKQFFSVSNTLMILVTSIKDMNKVNIQFSNQILKDFIYILEKLMLNDLSYFPSTINSIQISILHLFSLDNASMTWCLDILKSDEKILKSLINTLCKIFTLSSSNLDKENNEADSKTDLINRDVFMLNVSLLKFLMNKIDSKYWHAELLECCVTQILYALFEKFLREKNSNLVFSVFELFLSFAETQVDHLIKSNFNNNTCLLVNLLFEYSLNTPANTILSKQAETTTPKTNVLWTNVLCLYIDIQTVLLMRSKYKYLNDSILFFGSYYEAMIQLIFKLNFSLDPTLLRVIQTICRYMTQISVYKKELCIHIPHSVQNLERLFCTVLQLCITKVSHLKSLIAKCHHGQQKQNQNQKLNADDLISCQNKLFSIISYCLDSLFNYMPNFAHSIHLISFDEYNLLLAVNLNPPSSFDVNSMQNSNLTFGSLLFLIDYCFKILHKHDLISSGVGLGNLSKTNLENALSPKKSVSINVGTVGTPGGNQPGEDLNADTKLPSKSLTLTLLEKNLNFLLTQIILCEKKFQFTNRDKMIFKRELSAEINLIMSGHQKTLRKSTGQSQYLTKSPTASTGAPLYVHTTSVSSTNNSTNSEFVKLLQSLIQKALN